METGKPGLASAPVHINSIAAQTEKRMDTQAPLTAVYIHTVPALPAQPYPHPPAAAPEPGTLHLAMPPLYSKETLPFLTIHIAGGLQSQPGLSLAAATPAGRPKSSGKHVCPHCGRDCMKPSVLEKHLRCHTGERPYPCTTCGISFKTQSNLYKHKRTQAHARLSSESEQSSLSSLDMSSSRETCTSSLSLDESVSMEKDAILSAAEITCPASSEKAHSAKKQVTSEENELSPADHKTKEPNDSAEVAIEGEKQRMENKKPPLNASQHLPLQRQEATLFSKQWENSVSRGKSQSHESTDSGFSESSDHYLSPSSVLPDHSLDSLTESTKEQLEETTNTSTLSETGHGGQEPKHIAREQEQKTLEERISKLISENTAVVEDKQLENVRPRKTVLSKQGSIDLPMPYTYKDSFHFDMKISKTPSVGLQRNRNPGFYSSVPTQQSTTTEHAPLTRSNSLPFSVTLLKPERSSPNSSNQSDYVTLARRGSSGQINPTGFSIKPVTQQSSTHRPLVRQTAVDCNHATDGLCMNSSVEEACAGSLSCDGDGSDICGEPSNRKFRRKKAQKFAYNKWYMYGGGTFKKLYNSEKGGDDGVIKGRKCSTNQEHEVVQGLQKRLSEVHKESLATTGTTINLASSSGIACHTDCPPAKLSFVSAVDFNLKTSQLHSSCSSLKSPLRKNLSLSVLPLPLTGSLVSHKTDSMSRAEDGRLNTEEKHLQSLQLCGSHIPSDRKKQKTDDKIICPLEMETDQNTVTHPPPSVTGSAPQQATNLSYINQNLKHTQLKGALFSPCTINANTLSVSTSPATSTASAANTSFLPKYQLKLPNASEPDSNPSPHVVDKPTVTDVRSFTSDLSSSNAEQTPLSLLMHSYDVNKTNACSSAQSQLILPCTATALCQAETLSLSKNARSSLAVVHRPFAATTVTTTCLQDYQAGLCSTSIQFSKSTEDSAPTQLPRPTASMVVNNPAPPTVTTVNDQTSAASITAFSQLNPNPPLSHTQLSPTSHQSIPADRPYANAKTPVIPCQIVPFDQMQPAAQNVFHVHTADLQICLQIISDEQLALIEPQIERQAGSTLSHRRDMEVIQNQTQRCTEKDHHQTGHQELDRSEPSPTLNLERTKPPLSAECEKAQLNLHLTELGNSTQATVSDQSKPPPALGSSQRPHTYSNVNMATETQSTTANVMSRPVSLKAAQSGKRQSSEEELALSLNRCTEEQHLPDSRAGQGGWVSPNPPGQNKLNVTSFSPSTVNQNSTRREMLGNESQHKLKNRGALCNVGTMEAKCEASVYTSSKLESGESHPTPLQVGLSQTDELPGSVPSCSLNKCKAPRQLNPQASISCSNPVESTISEAPNSTKHANVGYDRVSPMDNSATSQETTPSLSQDVISFEKQQQFTPLSSNIQVERPKDIPAVLTSIQSHTAGLVEGDCLSGHAAQRQSQTREYGGSSGQPDCTNWRPKQSQDAGETNHQCMDGQDGGRLAGEDKNRGIKTDEQPGEFGKGEDRMANEDSSKNSWLSEQHLQHFSQMHCGMSEYSKQSSQQTPSTSNNLNLPASGRQTGLFNSPQPPLELNSFYLSQHWESSIMHNQQTQVACDSHSSQHIKVQAEESDTQNAFSQSESDPQQTSIPPSVQQRNTTGSNNIAAVSSCGKLTSGSHKSPSPDVRSSPTTQPSQMSYSAVGRDTVGLNADTQAANSNMLDTPFTYIEPVNYQDTKDKPTSDYTSQASNCERPDITNKYQTFFFSSQLHGYPPAECLTGAVRPVQSCQDYTEDTSSSDDEGKLIIEL